MNFSHLSSSLKRCLRIGALGAATLALWACATQPSTIATPPKLVVFIAVDGLPQRQVLAYRDQLAADGLARFLDRGAWFSNAHYGHAFTVTAAGHATMLTGAYPHRTGIIGNDWRDPATGAPIYNTQDPSAHYIDHTTKPLDGTSPKNLKVETVGDVLRRVDGRSKVIAISGKDRGAILPAGKAGTAYMYMAQSGGFASSTYYMAEHPAWVKSFNDAKPAHRYFKTEWKPLLDDAAYARSLPDRQVWYAPGGQLPMTLGAGDEIGLNFYSTLLRSPAADALSLDFARAALDGEHLGQDSAPDILSISLSAHDYINHAFSAESRMSHDHLLQIDRMLQAFFADLDAKVGKENYLAVLTADHGFTPASQTLQSRGLTAGRQSGGQTLSKLSEGLNQRFGEGKWVHGFSASSILFDKHLLAQRGIDQNTMAEAARTVLATEPGLGAIYTRRELDGNTRVGEPFFDAMRKSWHSEVSGDLQTAVQLNWMFTGSSAATHGSPHVYDTHVPILLYGPRWIGPGQIDQRVEVVDIAPTLALWLGVPAPAASEGRVLPLPAVRSSGPGTPLR